MWHDLNMDQVMNAVMSKAYDSRIRYGKDFSSPKLLACKEPKFDRSILNTVLDSYYNEDGTIGIQEALNRLLEKDFPKRIIDGSASDEQIKVFFKEFLPYKTSVAFIVLDSLSKVGKSELLYELFEDLKTHITKDGRENIAFTGENNKLVNLLMSLLEDNNVKYTFIKDILSFLLEQRQALYNNVMSTQEKKYHGINIISIVQRELNDRRSEPSIYKMFESNSEVTTGMLKTFLKNKYAKTLWREFSKNSSFSNFKVENGILVLRKGKELTEKKLNDYPRVFSSIEIMGKDFVVNLYKDRPDLAADIFEMNDPEKWLIKMIYKDVNFDTLLWKSKWKIQYIPIQYIIDQLKLMKRNNRERYIKEADEYFSKHIASSLQLLYEMNEDQFEKDDK